MELTGYFKQAPAVILTAVLSFCVAPLLAQNSEFVSPQNVDPTTAIRATAQPWLIHQDWYCREPKLRPDVFSQNVRRQLTSIAGAGWEIVGFTSAPIAGKECFVATFKAPKK